MSDTLKQLEKATVIANCIANCTGLQVQLTAGEILEKCSMQELEYYYFFMKREGKEKWKWELVKSK